MIEFVEFPKIARLSREITVSEKIDGSNGQIHIRLECDPETGAVRERLEFGVDTQIEVDGRVAFVRAGSRSRWLAHGGKDDNFGFGAWVTAHAHELAALGVGSHFGEWWGSGIQRGYGLPQGEKRFSLFNVGRWVQSDEPLLFDGQAHAPNCCHIVPILWEGLFRTETIYEALTRLRVGGSYAAPGFMNPEGIVIWHTAARIYFKKTIAKDEEYKGKAA